jgi:hypothetical protein
VIYDPLLGSSTNPDVTPDAVTDELVSGQSQRGVQVQTANDSLLPGALISSVQPEDGLPQLMVREEKLELVVDPSAISVIVDGGQVSIVSAGEVGPPGPPGPQGLPGNPYTGIAPVQVDTNSLELRLAPGTINGDGLLWNGFQWAPQPVVPSGMNGTVPFKAGEGFEGDDTHFRYIADQQALRVTRLEAALLDGGNF